MKRITFTLLFLFGLMLNNYAAAGKQIITLETFGEIQYGTGSGDHGNNVTQYTQGWGAPAGPYWSWRFDKVTTLTSTNGHWLGGSDSTCRIVSYAASNTLPASPNVEYPNPSKGCQLLLTNRMPNYAGSWDTAIFADINITDYVVSSINFGFAKNGNLFINKDTSILNVKYRIDGGAWMQADTSSIDGFFSGSWRYEVLPVPDVKGSKMDIMFIGLTTSQALIDDIAVIGSIPGKPMPIENIVVGAVDSPQDFTATVSMEWDLDSVYMFFAVTDDSIVNTGTSYQVDNIEVYFDMDNSKNVHWPRNGGWVSGDATFDANDHQLRLVPDVAFSVNNAAFTGASQIYTKNDTGYTFQLNVEWNSLMPDFSQVSSTVQISNTLIGFDVLVSDNDAVASDANRNQITFNSSTDKAFNDPSLWGTLKLLEDFYFGIIPDETKPSVPANVAGEVDNVKGEITITWDPSTDDIAVMSYTISVNDTPEAAPVFAKEEGNSYVLKNLANGTYNLAVKANDNNGNVSDNSATETVEVAIIGIQDNNVVFGTYPNPVASLLFINNASTIKSVEIIAINGSVMSQKTNDQSELMSFDVSSLAKGIYILKMQTVNGSVVTSKLVKE